jgi:hypothetical protein
VPLMSFFPREEMAHSIPYAEGRLVSHSSAEPCGTPLRADRPLLLFGMVH